MLRKHETPLQQIITRYEERCNNENIDVIEPLQFTFRVKEPDCFFLSNSEDIVQPIQSSKLNIKMWIVVCFEDNTIAAVPQFWFERGTCAWPSSLIDARSFAKESSEVSSNENYVFEENQKNRNKSKRSYAGSSKEFSVPKLPTFSSGDAVHTMKKYHDVPYKDIEKPIKLWMAQASEQSLSSLAYNLSEDKTRFRETLKIFSLSTLNLVTRKGVFSYEYIDHPNKLTR
ncbi:DUF4806 domain-containing protein [Aphis craccivora]|uniref:DUF4806 domain-containing protein n=1 Tax=Aphis craccivora TaxID=307492 RepID=A0A6G0W1J7_APHCR|nr:DUF4806 domain-containing protein [Aphis craccivora]